MKPEHDDDNEVRQESMRLLAELNPFKDCKPFDFSDDDDSMIDEEDGEALHLLEAIDTHSTSDFFSQDAALITRREPTTHEHDRFIPQRQHQVSKFEAKEILFSTAKFDCQHSSKELCQDNYACSAQANKEKLPIDSQTEVHGMFQALLCSQLFNAVNPHSLKAGALNNGMQGGGAEEEEGGLVQADRLSLKYNALNFRCPEVTQVTYKENAKGVNQSQVSPNWTQSSISAFKDKAAASYQDENTILPAYCGFDEDQLLSQEYKKQREIAKQPVKVLDAPCLTDDFYLNLVDWSAKNVLAVGLGSSVYTWSATDSRVNKLSDLGTDERVTSVQYSRDGDLFAVGTHSGELQIWDTTKNTLLRTLSGHNGRISTIAWNSTFLSTGSKDHSILHRDLRCRSDFTARLRGHTQEVCGLQWSFDDQQLASGGNDNKLLLWCARSSLQPLAKFNQHKAAVKAIAWSPHKRGLLTSGGGTQDRTIKFWNTIQCKNLKSIDTGSQVCSLMFAKNVNELVSTHGYSQNQINVWKYPSMKKIASLTGHSYRVLYLAMSPDGQQIVTGAGDETLRFWNVFPPKKQRITASIVMPSFNDLR